MAQAGALGMRYSRAAQGYVATASYLIGDYAGAVAAAEVAGDAIINLPAWQAASLVRLGELRGRRAGDAALPRAGAAGLDQRAGARRDDAIDWFMGCFPIRDEAVRSELRAGLMRALAEMPERG